MDEKALIEAENIRNIFVDPKQISNKVGVEQVDQVFENVFQNGLFMEALKWRMWINSLLAMIMDENELQVFKNGLEKRSGDLGQWKSTYYTTDDFSVLKKQFSLVDKTQLSTSQDYEGNMANDFYCGLEEEVYPIVRDIINKSHSKDKHLCEEDVDGENPVVTFVHLYFGK